MEINKIDNPAEPQPVYYVAERAADDEAERDCRPAARHPAHPQTEAETNDQREGRYQPDAGIAFTAEQAKTDSTVFHRHKIEESEQFDAPWRLPKAVMGDQFRDLIEKERQHRDRQTKADHARLPNSRSVLMARLFRRRLMRFDRVRATGANFRMFRPLADFQQYLPAARAFFAVRDTNYDLHTGNFFKFKGSVRRIAI